MPRSLARSRKPGEIQAMSKLSVNLRNSSQGCLMYWVVLCVLYVGLSSCSDGAPSRPAAGESGEVSFAIRMGKAVAETLARAEVVITGSDMEDVRQELTINDNVVTGLVRNIPAGEDRLFTLNGYDSSGSLAYTGSATADVVAGQQVTVRITMKRPEGRKIYWKVDGTIRRANLDGSEDETLVTRGGNKGGVVLDVGEGKMYWTNVYYGKIQRSNLDGSQVEDLLIELGKPDGLGLNLSGRKMYWTNHEGSKIQRANFDGSRIETLVSTGLSLPSGLVLDVGAKKMYWTDRGSDKIQRANLDGSQVENLIITGLSDPARIALDVEGGKMYWTDYEADKIQRANLDGTQIEDLLTNQNRVDGPMGIVLDLRAGKMYWAERTAHRIRRANLDGTQIEEVTRETAEEIALGP